MRFGIIDANEQPHAIKQPVSSVVGRWLDWELKRAGFDLFPPAESDVVFLCFAGTKGLLKEVPKALRAAGLEPRRDRRKGGPLVIGGGMMATVPFLAAEWCDAWCVGEGYILVREILRLAGEGRSAGDILAFCDGWEHAVAGWRVSGLKREPGRPWLLVDRAPKLASPDVYVDWSVPPVKAADRVVRVLGSKGCHCRCAFCATSWCQTYRENPHPAAMVEQMAALAGRGERVQLLSNDGAWLDAYPRIKHKLDSQSFTLRSIQKPGVIQAVIDNKVGIVRFGVEGITSRLRRAIGKPVDRDVLVSILRELSQHKVTTHLFYIAGLPGETEADWQEFRHEFADLTRVLEFGLCRIKITSFAPNAPSPLVRFTGNPESDRWQKEFLAWVAGNRASRHIIVIHGKTGWSRVDEFAEGIGVDRKTAESILPIRNYDLLPTQETADRAVWETIAWPTSATARWQAAETYMARATDRELT